jgi:predicted nuclease of predicted toxin-antitoxin system
VLGAPPSIIWLRTGNQPRAATLKALLDHQAVIEEVLLEKAQVCIELLR